MTLFDTDILTLHFAGHSQVTERVRAAEETPVISVISRIEVMQGRFDSVLKAANGDQLLRAQQWLVTAERGLEKFEVVSFDVAATAEFDKLRQNKKLKKIGRADLLIAAIALTHRATLITRNLKHFQRVPGLKVASWAD
jgi:tRNA(fMet)-specific endonuclease VapC